MLKQNIQVKSLFYSRKGEKSTLLHLSHIAVAIDYIMIMDFRFGVNDFNPAAFSPTFRQGIAGQLCICAN